MVNQELFLQLEKFLTQRLSMVEIEGDKLKLNQGICFTISKIGCKIMRRLGYNCVVQRVWVLVGDKIGRRMFLEQEKTNAFDKDKIVNAGGWTISMGLPRDKEDYDFHYVIYFPDKKEVMDLTFSQANRTEHNVVAKNYWTKLEDLPESIIRIYPIQKEVDDYAPLYYEKELKEWKEETILLGYKLLKKFKRK
jgi:hypothetical protein